MSSSYEQNYRKIAPLSDLPEGTPRVFRAAGATVVLLRRGNAIDAIDGSCVTDDTDMSAQLRLSRILECVSAAVRSSTTEWQALVAKAGLSARVEGGWAWVCLDGCRREDV